MTTDQEPAAVSLESRMVEARRAGMAAARDGGPVSANPHDATADTAAERVLAKMWTAGYGEANPMPDVETAAEDE